MRLSFDLRASRVFFDFGGEAYNGVPSKIRTNYFRLNPKYLAQMISK